MMSYSSKHEFPQHTEQFPIMHRPSLITNAFFEAKAITQAPDAMVYLTALSTVSVALQGLINVELPIGKLCPVSIFALTIAESGERKSTVENLLTLGIKKFEKEVMQIHRESLDKYNLELELYENEIAHIKRKGGKQTIKEQYKEMADELLSFQDNKPVKPRLPFQTYEDSTPEALVADLSNSIPNVFIGSSEGGLTLKSKLMSQAAILNSLWSNDETKINRKVDGSSVIKEARLTVHIMAQPSAFAQYMKKTGGDARGNGYLSRNFVCAPASNCGSRYANGFENTKDNLNKFNDRVYELMTKANKLEDYTQKTTIHFDDKAKAIWLEIYNDIEFKMGPNGIYQYARDHASKLPENIARLAALIHCFDNPSDRKISVASLQEAVNLTGYFSSQFMNMFLAPPRYVTNANNLMHWFNAYINSGIRYIKRNSILQYGPSGTRKKKDLEEALNYLRSSFPVAEFVSKKTRVIDLNPMSSFDEIKLKQDLLLDVIF